MDHNILKSWNYRDLSNWLKDPSVQECRLCDWKSEINLESKSLRTSFCAFANTGGGFIFFGVDNVKDIKGVKEDPELRTKISRIINNNILPPIPINNWDIITIEVPRKKPEVVYIVYILPSLYFEKPHVTEHKIYIRGNGENIPINDGGTLRKLFLIDKFQPEHIYQLESELEKIRGCRLNPDAIDFMYLKQMKEYLEEQKTKSRDFNELSVSLSKIIELYEKIKKKQSRGLLSGEDLSALDKDDLVKCHKSLNILVNGFYNKFKEVHNL